MTIRNLAAYLRAVATRKAIDRLRAQTRRAQRENEHGAAIVSRPTRPDEDAERGELREAERRAIDALPPKWRKALELRRIDGLTSKEAAALLGCSVSSIESWVRSADTQLRAALERFRDEDGQ